jgi:predicted transcriptional regulator
MSNILNVFFRKSPKEVLFRINRIGYTRQPDIYRGKEITFSHALKLINKFEQGEIITKEKIGREHRIRLTEKGRDLYDQLQAVIEILKEEE